MSCAMALAVFDITKAVEDNKVIEPQVKYTSGTIRFVRCFFLLINGTLIVRYSHPEPFKCVIRPRSAKAASLIAAVQDLA
jgi:hypothetical protein